MLIACFVALLWPVFHSVYLFCCALLQTDTCGVKQSRDLWNEALSVKFMTTHHYLYALFCSMLHYNLMARAQYHLFF